MAMNETELKSLLQIQDFRHIPKDKVIALASSIDNLDPKVAMSVIEQFPNYIGALRACVSESSAAFLCEISRHLLGRNHTDRHREGKSRKSRIEVKREEIRELKQDKGQRSEHAQVHKCQDDPVALSVDIDQADDAQAARRQEDRHGVVSRRLDLDLHQSPEHERYDDDIDDAAVDRDELQDRAGSHLAAGDAGHHPAVVGDEPAGHHAEEVLRDDDFAEGVLDGKYDNVDAVDGHRDEPDDPSEGKPDLIVEASEHHPAHAEGAVQTGGDRQVIFFQAGLREHRYFDRITDHKDRSDRHDQIAQPHKTETSVDIAQSHKTQESGDTGYRDFF